MPGIVSRLATAAVTLSNVGCQLRLNLTLNRRPILTGTTGFGGSARQVGAIGNRGDMASAGCMIVELGGSAPKPHFNFHLTLQTKIWCTALYKHLIWRYSMEEAIDRIMNSSEIEPILRGQNREEIKAKIGNYVAMLSSAGRWDANQLTEYGLAYLRGLHHGPDSRYTGC
jgi:hypothetical protein